MPPFWAESEQAIFDAVLKGQVDFESAPWPHISKAAKDLVKKMLKQDPKQRLSANQVLSTYLPFFPYSLLRFFASSILRFFVREAPKRNVAPLVTLSVHACVIRHAP